MAKEIGLPLAKNLFGAAASELLKVLVESSKPKEKLGSVANTTVRKQLGGEEKEGLENSTTATLFISHRRFSRLKRTKNAPFARKQKQHLENVQTVKKTISG